MASGAATVDGDVPRISDCAMRPVGAIQPSLEQPVPAGVEVIPNADRKARLSIAAFQRFLEPSRWPMRQEQVQAMRLELQLGPRPMTRRRDSLTQEARPASRRGCRRGS